MNAIAEQQIINQLRQHCWERPIGFLTTMEDLLSKVSLLAELSSKRAEETVEYALRWVVSSRMIVNVEEMKNLLYYELSIAENLKSYEATIREILRLLDLPPHLGPQMLISYYHLIGQILDNVQTITLERQIEASKGKFNAYLSLMVGNARRSIRLVLREWELDGLNQLIRESRKTNAA